MKVKYNRQVNKRVPLFWIFEIEDFFVLAFVFMISMPTTQNLLTPIVIFSAYSMYLSFMRINKRPGYDFHLYRWILQAVHYRPSPETLAYPITAGVQEPNDNPTSNH